MASDPELPSLIPVDQIRRVEFSGKDTADGRSWETWLKNQSNEGTPVSPPS